MTEPGRRRLKKSGPFPSRAAVPSSVVDGSIGRRVAAAIDDVIGRIRRSVTWARGDVFVKRAAQQPLRALPLENQELPQQKQNQRRAILRDIRGARLLEHDRACVVERGLGARANAPMDAQVGIRRIVEKQLALVGRHP